MKPVKEILRSPRFMREISVLLFFFAGLSLLIGLLLISAATSDAEVMASAIGSIVQAVVYSVLGFMIRRGSVKALWVVGILFVLDTVFQLAEPSGKALGAAIVSRGILIYVLVRYIRRERMSA